MLTVPEAAKLVGRHPETLRRWIRAGHLRSQRVGTQHLVDEQEVRALTDTAALELPDAWTIDDAGRRQPPWEELVRDSRAGH